MLGLLYRRAPCQVTLTELNRGSVESYHAQRVGRGESRGTGMSEPCKRLAHMHAWLLDPGASRQTGMDGKGFMIQGPKALGGVYGSFFFVIFTAGATTIQPLCRPVNLQVSQTRRP